MWWLIGYLLFGFVVSGIWHIVMIRARSRELERLSEELSVIDDLGDYEKGVVTANRRKLLQARIDRKPFWLLALAPWLIFTTRLD